VARDTPAASATIGHRGRPAGLHERHGGLEHEPARAGAGPALGWLGKIGVLR